MNKITRDENGLVVGVNYVFTEDGQVDWRKMIKPEYLVPNKSKTQETDITKLEDKDLLILLAGIKNLAALRGYTRVSYKPIGVRDGYVAVACDIEWLPNFETENRFISYSSIGDASYANTDELAKLYLAPIAENRAFVRTVRNFLRINILGKEELGAQNVSTEALKDEEVSKKTFTPHQALSEYMKKSGKTIEDLKKFFLEKYPDSANWNTLEDVPNNIVLKILSKKNKES